MQNSSGDWFAVRSHRDAKPCATACWEPAGKRNRLTGPWPRPVSIQAGAAFNAAKERALDGFIAGQIGFLAMAEVVEEVLTRLSAESSLSSAPITLDNVRQMDHLARQRAEEIIGSGQ